MTGSGTMDRLSSLPNELIIEIFSHIRQHEDDHSRSIRHWNNPSVGSFDTTRNWRSPQNILSRLCQVSKFLGSVAEGFLYEQVHVLLGRSVESRPRSQLASLTESLALRPDLARLVRSLKLTNNDFHGAADRGDARITGTDPYDEVKIKGLISLFEKIPNVETILLSIEESLLCIPQGWRTWPERTEWIRHARRPPLPKLKSFKVYLDPEGQADDYTVADVQDVWRLLPVSFDTMVAQRWMLLCRVPRFFFDVRDLTMHDCIINFQSFKMILCTCKDLRRFSFTLTESHNLYNSLHESVTGRNALAALERYSAATLVELELDIVDECVDPLAAHANPGATNQAGSSHSLASFARLTKLEVLTLKGSDKSLDTNHAGAPWERIARTVPKSLKRLKITDWSPRSVSADDIFWLGDAATEGRLPNLEKIELQWENNGVVNTLARQF
ncbi:hypothetical protein CMUS01_09602 [Colletotrichum musicola]|uniref:Uncharacterized protein n=1 Tax=Colletotrichum musicola TaxID=2175873 RepID=A0A8H6K785_9PEZI|nr:hypothetical protein CMUS01_09602 [Colletotrichum musicola]